MPKCKVVILTPALNDIHCIADNHLMRVGPKSSEKITNNILDRIIMLEEHPLAGSDHYDPVLHKQNYRKLVCGNYICVYKLIGESVYIYRVVHGATDYPNRFKWLIIKFYI